MPQIKITKAMQTTLASWLNLNKDINKYNEKELKLMLRYELYNEARTAVIKRIKQKIIGIHTIEFKKQLDKDNGGDGD